MTSSSCAGATFDNVVKLTTYFAGKFHDYTDYFAVRREYFKEPYPASTGVQVAALAFPELLLEVEAIVYLPEGTTK